jgi:hypothetical protein
MAILKLGGILAASVMFHFLMFCGALASLAFWP